MIDIISRNGKRIGRISDSLDNDDTLIVNGKEIKLRDVYADDKIKEAFNTEIKELKNAKQSDDTEQKDDDS